MEDNKILAKAVLSLAHSVHVLSRKGIGFNKDDLASILKKSQADLKDMIKEKLNEGIIILFQEHDIPSYYHGDETNVNSYLID